MGEFNATLISDADTRNIHRKVDDDPTKRFSLVDDKLVSESHYFENIELVHLQRNMSDKSLVVTWAPNQTLKETKQHKTELKLQQKKEKEDAKKELKRKQKEEKKIKEEKKKEEKKLKEENKRIQQEQEKKQKLGKKALEIEQKQRLLKENNILPLKNDEELDKHILQKEKENVVKLNSDNQDICIEENKEKGKKDERIKIK